MLLLGQDVGTRMTVVRLADGGLFVHSPIDPDPELRRALDLLGPVRAIVAPAKGHNLFAPAFAAALPEAKLYVCPGLAERRPELASATLLGDEPPPLWAGTLEQHVVRGIPFMNEVAFFHAASRTLILTDLAFNVKESHRARAPIFWRLVGAVGRFGPHRIIRAGVRDRAALRRSIDRILEWDFERVTVTHGDVLEGGGREALRQAYAYLKP